MRPTTVPASYSFCSDNDMTYDCIDSKLMLSGEVSTDISGSSSGGACPTSFMDTSVGCLRLHKTELSWCEARKMCLVHGSDLYSPATSELFLSGVDVISKMGEWRGRHGSMSGVVCNSQLLLNHSSSLQTSGYQLLTLNTNFGILTANLQLLAVGSGLLTYCYVMLI